MYFQSISTKSHQELTMIPEALIGTLSLMQLIAGQSWGEFNSIV
jgi:hypothetical protein